MTNNNISNEPLAPNYQYWRDHGHDWPREYDQRKTWQPYLHVQEWMLAHYFARCAPLRVLEFGCGVGRHLKNLAAIPGIDVHGYDQSQGMTSGIRRWASPQWFDSHVTIGPPTGPLPFPDRSFDVVYTSEVLLHVRPQDLEPILHEFLRIAKDHILHIEPPPTVPLVADDHAGCWSHDLVASYQRLGRDCLPLPQGYEIHTPFRVPLASQGPTPPWDPALLAIMRRLDADLRAGLAQRDHALAHERAQADLARANAQHAHARAEQDAQALRDSARQAASHAQSITSALDNLRDLLQQRLSDTQAAADSARAASHHHESHAAALRDELDHLRAELSRQRDESNRLSHQVGTLEQSLHAAQHAAESQRQELASALRHEQGRLHALAAEHQSLLQRASTALARSWGDREDSGPPNN